MVEKLREAFPSRSRWFAKDCRWLAVTGVCCFYPAPLASFPIRRVRRMFGETNPLALQPKSSAGLDYLSHDMAGAEVALKWAVKEL